ncbi:MAG: tetratricopeptide repeat protein, partial [Ferruginibacter sp.]
QGIGLCYASLVEYYAKQKDYKKALEYNLKGIQILEAIEDRVRTAEAKDIRGNLYIEMNNYTDALKIFLEDLKVYQEMGDSINTAGAYNNVGFAYSKLKKYDESVNYFNKGLLLAKEVGAKDKMLNCYRSLAELYEMKNDYKNAYRYHKLYFAMNDSLFNETKSKQVAEMKTRYETEKKGDDIALLNKNKEIQNIEINKQKLLKNSFIGGLLLMLVLFFLIYNNYRTRQKLKLENIRNNIAADLHDDIGSTLNSISLFSEVAKQEAGKPIPALDQIGVSARKIIDAMSDIVWTINPENDTFENVIARMRSLAYLLLKAKQIEFIFRADENLNHLSLPMPVRKNFYMLFKEAINNLVKYSNATNASFHISLDNNNVKLLIHDNGVGFDEEHVLMGNGIKNMKRRAAEIGAQLLIESAEGKGTNIELSFKT